MNCSQPSTKLQRDQADALVDAYAAGASFSHLAKVFGIHRQTANAHLQRRGITIRPETSPLTDEQSDRAVELYGQGSSAASIGSRLGVDASTIAPRPAKARRCAAAQGSAKGGFVSQRGPSATSIPSAFAALCATRGIMPA